MYQTVYTMKLYSKHFIQHLFNYTDLSVMCPAITTVLSSTIMACENVSKVMKVYKVSLLATQN